MSVTFNGVPGFATPGAFVPGLPIIAAPPPVPPSPFPSGGATSGGTVNFTLRVWRSIGPGDVPASGAARPHITGRAYSVPVAADVEHVTHAWTYETPAEPEPAPGMPPVPPLAGMLDALGHAASAAYAASARAVELGRFLADPPYRPAPKTCGATRKVGGVRLTCGRQPRHRGKHRDKGLDWG